MYANSRNCANKIVTYCSSLQITARRSRGPNIEDAQDRILLKFNILQELLSPILMMMQIKHIILFVSPNINFEIYLLTL